MTIKTIILEIEEGAEAALTGIGTVLKSFVLTEGQKLIAEVKQTYIGTVALNIVSALESHTMSGADKLQAVIAAAIPLITKLASSGGLSGVIASVESFALEFAQSVYQDFKQNVVAKVAGAL